MYDDYELTKASLEILKLRLQAIKENQKLLESEEPQLLETEKKLTTIIEEIEKNLKTLKGIKHELYYALVVDNLKPNKAVEKIAFKYDLTPSTIWKNYYPDVKKLIQK